MKKCDKCNEEKDLSEFYICGERKDGTIRYHNMCKICVLEYNRTVYNENEKYKISRKQRVKKQQDDPNYIQRNKERGAAFYSSIRGRSMTLLKSAQRRASKFKEFDLDLDFIMSKVECGHCEVTGIKFDFNKPTKSKKNPYAPSIDRIDGNIGYIKSNVRIVIWQYNLMKGELSDNELFNLCQIICNKGVNDNDK